MKSRQLSADSLQPGSPRQEHRVAPGLRPSTVGCRLLAVSLLVAGLLWRATAAAVGDTLTTLEREYKQRCQALAANHLRGKYQLVVGMDGWLLLQSELKYASSGPFWGVAALTLRPDIPLDRADPITAIAAFRDELAKKGIDLLFVPAPTRPVVVPESVLGRDRLPAGKTPRLQPVEEEFFAALHARGVAAIDLTPVLLAHRDDEHGPLYVSSDPHWTSKGNVLAAQEIARWVKRQPWFAKVLQQRFETTWKPFEHSGPHYRDLVEGAGLEKRPPDLVQVREVHLVGAGGHPVKVESRQPDSPVILIGDSHTVWWRSQEAALFQQLACELGFPVDTLSTSGGGPNESRLNLVRQVRATPGYLASKKLVIWCFASRDLLGPKEGWIRTPLDAPADEGDASASTPQP